MKKSLLFVLTSLAVTGCVERTTESDFPPILPLASDITISTTGFVFKDDPLYKGSVNLSSTEQFPILEVNSVTSRGCAIEGLLVLDRNSNRAYFQPDKIQCGNHTAELDGITVSLDDLKAGMKMVQMQDGFTFKEEKARVVVLNNVDTSPFQHPVWKRTFWPTKYMLELYHGK